MLSLIWLVLLAYFFRISFVLEVYIKLLRFSKLVQKVQNVGGKYVLKKGMCKTAVHRKCIKYYKNTRYRQIYTKASLYMYGFLIGELP